MMTQMATPNTTPMPLVVPAKTISAEVKPAPLKLTPVKGKVQAVGSTNGKGKAKLAPAPKAKAPKAKVAKPVKEAKPAKDPLALAEAHDEVKRRIELEAGRRKCVCGCGGQVTKAFFLPGHDAKLLSAILKGEAKPVK